MNAQELIDIIREIFRVNRSVRFSHQQEMLLEKSNDIVQRFALGYIHAREFCEEIELICRRAMQTEPCKTWRRIIEDVRSKARVVFVENLC